MRSEFPLLGTCGNAFSMTRKPLKTVGSNLSGKWCLQLILGLRIELGGLKLFPVNAIAEGEQF
jgi:hypothetical protein